MSRAALRGSRRQERCASWSPNSPLTAVCNWQKQMLSAIQASRFLSDITRPGWPGANCLPIHGRNPAGCASAPPQGHWGHAAPMGLEGGHCFDARPAGTSLSDGHSVALRHQEWELPDVISLIISSSDNTLSPPISGLISFANTFPKESGDGSEDLARKM